MATVRYARIFNEPLIITIKRLKILTTNNTGQLGVIRVVNP